MKRLAYSVIEKRWINNIEKEPSQYIVLKDRKAMNYAPSSSDNFNIITIKFLDFSKIMLDWEYGLVILKNKKDFQRLKSSFHFIDISGNKVDLSGGISFIPIFGETSCDPTLFYPEEIDDILYEEISFRY